MELKCQLDQARAKSDPSFAENVLAGHWTELLAWWGKAGQNAPEIGPLAQAWQDFQAAGSCSDGLGAQASGLATAESLAMDHGYIMPGWHTDDDDGHTFAVIVPGTGARSPGPWPPHAAAVRVAKVGTTIPAALPTPDVDARNPLATAIGGGSVGRAMSSASGSVGRAVSSAVQSVSDLAPAPADPYLAPKAAAVGALAVATVATTLLVEKGTHKALAAAVGSVATIGLGAFLFSRSKPAAASDPKAAGLGDAAPSVAPGQAGCDAGLRLRPPPPNRARHAHRCPKCSTVWWHDPDACRGPDATHESCAAAHACPACGTTQRRIDLAVTRAGEQATEVDR